VLATKSDGLVTTRVGVECKAWAGPIEKDVVAKLSFVVNDLAINKGIVVSLHGWRLGAEQTAADLGIDLWGPTEIEQHLRELGPAADARTARVGLGWAAVVAPDHAEGSARAAGKRRSGLRTRTVEELAWFGRVWLPCFRLELSVTAPHSLGKRKTELTTVQVVNLYDALDGSLISPSPTPGPPDEIQLDGLVISPKLEVARVTTAIRRNMEKIRQVTQGAALGRYWQARERLGIHANAKDVTVSGSRLVHLPVYLGVLHGASHERIVAIDGITGNVSSQLSALFTKHHVYLKEQLSK
jgi:Restriction endonuclease